MASIYNALSGYKVDVYNKLLQEADTKDTTDYNEVDFCVKFTSSKAVINSGLAASVSEDLYKKEEKDNDKKYIDIEKETMEAKEYKITENYKDDNDNGGFDSES